MPTIIECITQAEAKGAELKKQAAARAKEITDDAEARRGKTIKEAHDAGRAMIQRAKDEAEKQGAALAAELTARVDALFRRAGGEEVVQSGEISQPPFLLNTRNRTLEKNGQRVKLTQVEYAIMRVFMENPGKALSREEILDRVWGRDYFGELKIVDVNIRRLRLKIEDNVQNPTFITTVWGYGYKWDA